MSSGMRMAVLTVNRQQPQKCYCKLKDDTWHKDVLIEICLKKNNAAIMLRRLGFQHGRHNCFAAELNPGLYCCNKV